LFNIFYSRREMMILSKFKILLIYLLPTSIFASNINQDVTLIQVRVGHPTITLGPVGNMIDNLFNSTKLSNGYLCFTANATSYLMTGSDPLCQGSALTAVLGPVANGYANCGLWVNDTLVDPTNSSHLYAFAHGEADCNYQIGQTNKSMEIAQSFDGGQTWALSGQIITGTDSPTVGKTTGEGDCNVIPDTDGFYYIYCLRNLDSKYIVARAPQSAPPLSGMWSKYNNGTWSSPGLAGAATALTAFGSASLWSEKDYTMLLSSPDASSGIVASFSADHVTFVTLPNPLLISDDTSWTREADSTELIGYVSVIGEQGGRVWQNGQFIMTYMYLEPGANFGSRYLVNRNVTLTLGTTPNTTGGIPQVGVELSRWTNTSTTPVGIWTTNAAAPGFDYVEKLGYLMTQQLSGTNAPVTVAIEECAGNWDGTNIDHVITPNGTCVQAGYTRLRTLGWLYQTQQANTAALYRCWSPTKYKSHFASLDPNCEGETTEFILGYILTS
jgi:hypothetical protein